MTESEVRAAVGPRADYYLAKWQHTAGGGFNWAAFFLLGFWLPYRKMYLPAGILFAAFVVESLVEYAIFVHWMGVPVPRAVEAGSGFLASAIGGRWGNRWYLGHIGALVDEARSVTDDEGERLRLLARRGGTSVWRAVLYVVFIVVIGALAAIGFEVLLPPNGEVTVD